MTVDPIDALNALIKSGDDDEAYMLGYKDAQAGKPAKPQNAAAQVDQEEADGDDDGVIENEPGNLDDDGDGDPGGGEEEAAAQEAAAGVEDGDEPDAIDALSQQAEGTDLDGDGDADMPGQDVDGDGEVEEAEEAPGDVQQGAPEEGADEAPLPPDDGKNHGVGDLDEDGQTSSLIDEIKNLEKLYYAAKGLHGGGHHKTEKALDLYHRAVRKMVRAQMGGGQPEGDPGEQQAEGGENGDAKKAPPFGKKGEDGNVDDAGDSDDEDKKKPPFGKSLDAVDRLVLQTGEPHEIQPILDRLAKAGGNPYDFIMKMCRSEVESAKSSGDKVDTGALAHLVVAKMIDRFSADPALRGAARQYNLSVESIEPILSQMLGIPPKEDPAIVSDAESHRAMGVERMAYSMDGSDLGLNENALAKGAEGLQVVDRGPKPLRLVDDTVDPSRAFAAHQRARMARMYKSNDSAPRATIAADCPFHGRSEEAIYKSHLINQGYLRCTCPSS